MRDQINLTDDQIEARFESLGCGLTVDDVVLTRETLDDWLSSRTAWTDPGTIDRHDHECLIIRDARVKRSQPRRDIYIVDFGDVRGVSI